MTFPRTKGPFCDENLMTSVDGVFSCGNALHVNDLVDYVSDSGETAGKAGAEFTKSSANKILLKAGKNLIYMVPQRLNLNTPNQKVVFYFRSRKVMDRCTSVIFVDDKEVFRKKYAFLRTPEMERIEYDLAPLALKPQSKVRFDIEEG